jgi:hypothetical protein
MLVVNRVTGKDLAMTFEGGPGQARLADDAMQSSARQFGMQRNRHSCCSVRVFPLHHHMTSSLAHSLKSMPLQNSTDGFTRERSEFRQP